MAEARREDEEEDGGQASGMLSQAVTLGNGLILV